MLLLGLRCSKSKFKYSCSTDTKVWWKQSGGRFTQRTYNYIHATEGQTNIF